MKKKIWGGIVLSAVAATAAWNVSLNSQSYDTKNNFTANGSINCL
jgi:hypothetical protein